MGYVYRYVDKSDGIIKYVGIVWSENRTLEQRIKEHSINDSWYRKSEWYIEYIEENINSRTDAEYFESHYISLYGTDKYYNKSKAGWGVSSYLPDRENEWERYSGKEFIKEKSECIYLIHWTYDNDFEIKPLPVIKKRCNKKCEKYEEHCKKCGSTNLYKKESNLYGQIYCKDCGSWVCQGRKGLSEKYTPEYNGEYEMINGENVTYDYYTIKYGREDCWKGFTRDELEKVKNGYVTYAPNFKDRRRTSIHTYALDYNEIEDAKIRILKYIKEQKESNIESIKNEMEELQDKIKLLPNKLKEAKQEYKTFLSDFKLLLSQSA